MTALNPGFQAQRSDWLFNAHRLLWVAGFAPMFAVNLATAPLAERTDRDKAVAAVRLGLKIPAYPSPSPAGEYVSGTLACIREALVPAAAATTTTSAAAAPRPT